MSTGVILAGGEGTRLRPLTLAFNKHALRIGGKMMIQFPVQTLIELGCKNIIVVSTSLGLRDFTKLLPDLYPDITFAFVKQENAYGIADALDRVRNLVTGEGFYVILGDNIFMRTPLRVSNPNVATIYVTRSKEGFRFGCVDIAQDGQITLTEKPEGVTEALVQTGLYFYPPDCFSGIDLLSPSARGELEITDLNSLYAAQRKLDVTYVEGLWLDAGTIESIKLADTLFS